MECSYSISDFEFGDVGSDGMDRAGDVVALVYGPGLGDPLWDFPVVGRALASVSARYLMIEEEGKCYGRVDMQETIWKIWHERTSMGEFIKKRV
jgi:hypothetical protein